MMPAALLPPVSPACISSPYGPRVLPGRPLAGTYHYGVDLPAAVGAPVRAAASGSVAWVRKKGAGGLEMLVAHDGFMTLYSHLGSLAPAIADGKRAVAAGEKLAVVGRTGVSYGSHVYFELRVNGERVDPNQVLGLKRCG
jgi:murein DD-endopeptidase MepM/ murein hydrolase activator NlpD